MRFSKEQENGIRDRTQNEIFLATIGGYYKKRKALSEYDFVSCLSLTYSQFRSVRITAVDTQTTQDFSSFCILDGKEQKVFGVFPLCDAVFDDGKRLLPRFLKKFSKKEIDIDDVAVRYRVNTVDLSTRPLKKILISTEELINSLQFIHWSNIIFKIFSTILVKSYFWRSTIKQKISLLKSLFIFELNYVYFSKINIYYKQSYDKLYLTNFYAPENLGLIKAFIEAKKEVVDLQHGVQKNVAAYEHNYLLPVSIKPTKFFTWFDLKEDMSNSTRFEKVDFSKIQNTLKTGSGLNIFISLQPSNTIKFFQSLNLLNLSRHFVKVRPHPRRILSQKELEASFEFEFVYDREDDIDVSLVGIDLHLTEYSSCVLDGIKMGVPSVCFHPIARDYFSDLDENHLIRIYNSIEDFLTDACNA